MTSFRLLMTAFGLLIVGDTISTAVNLWLTVGNTAYDMIWLLSTWRGARRRCIAPAVLAVENLIGGELDVWPVVGGSTANDLVVQYQPIHQLRSDRVEECSHRTPSSPSPNSPI